MMYGSMELLHDTQRFDVYIALIRTLVWNGELCFTSTLHRFAEKCHESTSAVGLYTLI